MAFGAATVWDVRAAGSDNNGGGFNLGNANFATDLAATSGTGNSPVVSSASYTFVAGDVGALVYVKSGTNWTPGLYPIASVSAGAATLSAAIGAAMLVRTNIPEALNTVAGCATTASPTAGTWGLCYCKQDVAKITFTDMIIGVTTTQFTSVTNPVGYNMVGNIINVTSGTGFTVQRVEVVSFTVSGLIATCDKSLGTAASTGGNGKLGGGLATIGTAVGVMLSTGGNTLMLQKGTYTLTSTVTFSIVGATLDLITRIWGYDTLWTDRTGTVPLITSSTNSVDLLTYSTCANIITRNIKFTHTAATRGNGVFLAGTNASGLRFTDLLFDGCLSGLANTSATSITLIFTRVGVINSTSGGVSGKLGAAPSFTDCYIRNNAGDGVFNNNTGQSVSVTFARCVVSKNTGCGYKASTTADISTVVARDCVFSENTVDGVSLANTAGAVSGAITSVNNRFYGNTNYGIRDTNANAHTILIELNNAFGANGTANRLNLLPNPTDITLAADPSTNASGGDYSLNTTAGGGALLRGVTYVLPGALVTSYFDIGGIQHQDAGGGGGGSVIGSSVVNTEMAYG